MMKNKKRKEDDSWCLDLHISDDIKNMMKDHLEQFSEIIHEVLTAAVCRVRGEERTEINPQSVGSAGPS